MKTKFKYFSLAIAALLMVGISSCSSDDVKEVDNTDSKDTKSGMLKISNAPATRAEVPAQATGAVTFTTGDVYFTTAEGSIIKYCTIGKKIGEFEQLDMNSLTSGTGAIVSGVPGNVKHVYIVGNSPIVLPAAGPISAVKAANISVASQKNITNVNLYGEAKELTSAGDNNYTVTVNITPTVARIELTDITGILKIAGFNVMGVFVDNYYSDAATDGTVALDNLKDNGKLAANYSDNVGNYITSNVGVVHDWYSELLAAVGKVAKPAAKDGVAQVWGYNVFAQNAEASAVPRIIIRLNGITTSDNSIVFEGVKFLTIKGFNNKVDGTPITKLEPSKIYNIAAGDLKFHGINLSDNPNLDNISVTVNVTVTEWAVVSVTPEL